MDKKNVSIEGLFCVGLLFLMTIFMFAEVVGRYLFQHSIYWAEELIRYLFIWFTFVGAAYCVKMRSHVTIDMFITLFPKKTQRTLMTLGHVIWICLTLFIVYWSARYTFGLIKTMELTTALKLPLFIVYMAIPVGFSCMGVRLIAALFRGKIYNEDHPEEDGISREAAEVLEQIEDMVGGCHKEAASPEDTPGTRK